jgi:hypothetical protein
MSESTKMIVIYIVLCVIAWLISPYVVPIIVAALLLYQYGYRIREKLGKRYKSAEPTTGLETKMPAPAQEESPTEQKPPTQLFCTNCGSELTPDSKFCNKCGTKQP